MREIPILQQQKVESKDIDVICPLCSKNLGTLKEITKISYECSIKVFCPFCKEYGLSYKMFGKPMFFTENCKMTDIKVLNENNFLIELDK